MEGTASKLVVQNLRKSFRTQRSEESIQVFEGISFEVHPAEFFNDDGSVSEKGLLLVIDELKSLPRWSARSLRVKSRISRSSEKRKRSLGLRETKDQTDVKQCNRGGS